ncbi:MAG: DUF1003 domain-containing protein [Rhodospirillales bacterium]|nr:DUF1003 domain-containing protein [Rhodospirillales bacterium]
MTDEKLGTLATRLMKARVDDLGELERRVLSHIARDAHISRHPDEDVDDDLTFGQRLADAVAAFGGSWTFICLFGAALAAWVALNSLLLSGRLVFDAYPYIFLNLILSMLAALQAPIIMMSQNRQSQRDRLAARHDYEVNLKAELDIMALHDKLDEFRTRQLAALIGQQEEQLRLLRALVDRQSAAAPG